MKIGIVTNTFPSLSETFIYRKVLALAKKGHHLSVFCTNKNEELFNNFFGETVNVQLIVLDKKNFTSYLLLHPFILLRSFFTKENKGRFLLNNFRQNTIIHHAPDVLHIEFSGIAIAWLPILKNSTVKKVVSCRGSAEKVKLLSNDKRKAALKEVFENVQAIHCVSQDMRQTILPYCAHPEKIFINYPSIDTNFFQPFASKKNNSTFTILSIGRFTFQKGYLTGLLAIKTLQKKLPGFKWLIIGEGPQQEELIFHIHHLQLQNHVELLGKKNTGELLALYSQAHCFFLPSVYEGIANVALEAMSMELPVVSTRSGGMDEVITPGLNGFLAGVYDASFLAACLLILANDEKTRTFLGKNARLRVIEKFTIETQAQLFENVYNN